MAPQSQLCRHSCQSFCSRRPVASSAAACRLRLLPFRKATQAVRGPPARRWIVQSTAEEVTAEEVKAPEETAAPEQETAKDASQPDDEQGDWVPVLSPEDLPKGVRKEVRVNGVNVLLFWYRNNIYAIEARSPAEGAYSEGFIKAKFTQDNCIECPGTGTLFSLETGEIKLWYPNNPVLRVITPQDTCRNLEIYPVKLGQDAIYVDVTSSAVQGQYASRGGANTSVEKNNVYGIEPKTYVDVPGIIDKQEKKLDVSSGVTLIIGILIVASAAVAGTAVGIYYENFIGLGLFWLGLFAATAIFVVQYANPEDSQ